MTSPPTATNATARAFTLAEVMMATVVTLVAVVGLIQAVTIGAEMLDVSRKQTVAMQLIRNEIDGVHLKDWATVSTLTDGATLTINSAGTDLSIGNIASKKSFALTNYTSTSPQPDDNFLLMSVAKGFTLSLTVRPVRPNFLQLSYTVTWTGGNRHKVYARSGTTYYGRYGLNLYYRK